MSFQKRLVKKNPGWFFHQTEHPPGDSIKVTKLDPPILGGHLTIQRITISPSPKRSRIEWGPKICSPKNHWTLL